MDVSEFYQTALNSMYSDISVHLREVASKYNLSKVKITNKIVYQYYSEDFQEYVDAICFSTGTVMLNSLGVARYIKYKELSIQDLINVIKSIEGGFYERIQ